MHGVGMPQRGVVQREHSPVSLDLVNGKEDGPASSMSNKEEDVIIYGRKDNSYDPVRGVTRLLHNIQVEHKQAYQSGAYDRSSFSFLFLSVGFVVRRASRFSANLAKIFMAGVS
jgi:hypothetical protein